MGSEAKVPDDRRWVASEVQRGVVPHKYMRGEEPNEYCYEIADRIIAGPLHQKEQRPMGETSEATSVGEDFPKQQARVRDLLDEYRKIPTGAIGAMMIEQVLQRAQAAQSSGDIIAILRSYEELRGCE